jgi:hypothetical protein
MNSIQAAYRFSMAVTLRPATKKFFCWLQCYIALPIHFAVHSSTFFMARMLTYLLTSMFVGAVVFLPASLFSQTIVRVTDFNEQGWTKDELYLGKVHFANGPSKPPLHGGSLQFNAPVNGHGRQVRMRNDGYSGILLSSITQLSYSTFVQKAGSKRDAPLLVLLVDVDDDGEEDYHFSFDPRFQNPKDTAGIPTNYGWYKPTKTADTAIRWQYPIRRKVWQTWDALHGAWAPWTTHGKTFDASPPLYSLPAFIAQYPNARIVNDEKGGGVRLQAGGIPMADNFLGNADAFTIGINGKTTVYDFELGTDSTNTQIQTQLAKSEK